MGIDIGTQMVNGQVYTHHLNVKGVSPDPGAIAVQLAGDTNFGSPSANYTVGGLFTTQVDVTFTYSGDGSIVGQNGQEAATVLTSGFTLASFEYTGTDTGITTAKPGGSPSNIPSWLMWAVIGIVAIAVIYVAGDVKAILPEKG